MNIISKPLVSICIPSYNSEKWIQSTIKSALSQTWPNKEIIIIDDGSTDKTYKIAKKFESDWVKIVSQKNSGACATRNYAFSFSKGEFIQWLDADDILHPDKISNQLRDIALYSDYKIIHTAAWGYFFYRLSNTKFIPDHLWKDMPSKDWLLERFGKGSYIPTHSWLVSRKLTEIAGPWDENLLRNQDGEYFSRVVSHSNYVKFHSKSICYYRKGHLNNISGSFEEKKIKSVIVSMRKSTSYLLKMEDNQANRQICIKYFQCFYNLHHFNYNQMLSNLVGEEITKLGGLLSSPDYKPRYALVYKVFGYKVSIKLESLVQKFKFYLRKPYRNLLSYIFRDWV